MVDEMLLDSVLEHSLMTLPEDTVSLDTPLGHST